jgi:hypothetical protein
MEMLERLSSFLVYFEGTGQTLDEMKTQTASLDISESLFDCEYEI